MEVRLPPFFPSLCSHQDNGPVDKVQALRLLRGGSGLAQPGSLSDDGGLVLLGVPRWSSESQVPTSLPISMSPTSGSLIPQKSFLLPEFCVFSLLPPPSTPRPLVQFSIVDQSCPTLCDPMDWSMPGLSVHHQLPEFTQTPPFSR